MKKWTGVRLWETDLTLRERLGYDLNQPVVDCSNDVKITQQHFADECDINKIVKKYSQGEIVTHVNDLQGVFQDVSEVGDYQMMLNTVTAAQQAFEALPIEIKRRFDQDPNKLIEFLENPGNRKEAEDLGLVNRRPDPSKGGEGDARSPSAQSEIQKQ